MLSATLSSVRVGGRSAAGAAWRSLSTVAVSAPAAAGSDTTADTTTNTSTTTTTSSSSSSASAEGAQAERNKKGIRFEVLQPLSFAQRPLGSVTEAIQAIKAFAVRPQPATVAMTLGIEMRDAKGRMGHPVHAMVALPYVQKKREIILVFARGDDAAIAKAAGATVVGGPELFADITAGKLKYDKVLATTDMLAEVKAVAKYLRQATPTVKKGTVADGEALGTLVQSMGTALDMRSDRKGFINVKIGKTNQPAEHLFENIRAVLKATRTPEFNHQSETPKYIGWVALGGSYLPTFPIVPNAALTQAMGVNVIQKKPVIKAAKKKVVKKKATK